MVYTRSTMIIMGVVAAGVLLVILHTLMERGVATASDCTSPLGAAGVEADRTVEENARRNVLQEQHNDVSSKEREDASPDKLKQEAELRQLEDLLEEDTRYADDDLIEELKSVSSTRNESEYRAPRTCTTQQRLANIKQYCKTRNPDFGPWGKVNILVVDKYKLIYCRIPKSGSTSTKTFLARSLLRNDTYRFPGEAEFYEDTGIRTFSHIDEDEQQELLKKYYKIALVRHPFDRLRSAFNDKIIKRNIVGDQIRERYQGAIGNYLVETGRVSSRNFDYQEHLLELEDYFHMVGRQQEDFQNVHWQTFGTLCQPCQIQYDKLLKLDTLEEDMEELLAHIVSVRRNAYIPDSVHTHRSVREEPVNKLGIVSKLMEGFKPEVMDAILDYVKDDFGWTGYGWDETRGAVCETSPTGCC